MRTREGAEGAKGKSQTGDRLRACTKVALTFRCLERSGPSRPNVGPNLGLRRLGVVVANQAAKMVPSIIIIMIWGLHYTRPHSKHTQTHAPGRAQSISRAARFRQARLVGPFELQQKQQPAPADTRIGARSRRRWTSCFALYLALLPAAASGLQICAIWPALTEGPQQEPLELRQLLSSTAAAA